MICCRCALRRPSAAFATYPATKVCDVPFYYNLCEISPNSARTPTLTHLTPLPHQPHVDLLLDLGKCHGKLGDATSYRG